MYCPKCAQQQTTQNLRFCSKCGFLLTGIVEVMLNNGVLPAKSIESARKKKSERFTGVLQGIFIMLSSVLVVPLVLVLSEAIDLPEIFVPLTAIILFIGGFLRIVYAVMFQDGSPRFETAAGSAALPGSGVFGAGTNAAAQPARSGDLIQVDARARPVSDSFGESGAITGELVASAEDSERTTKLLDDCDR